MTSYSYKAISADGKTCKGLQDATSQAELEFSLKRCGLYLIDARANEKVSAKTLFFGARKILRSDLITFFFNLDQLLRAGVPLLECLADLRDSMDDPRFREIIAAIVESIESGATLSQAMGQHPQAFDPISVGLTHAGEESGRLAEVSHQLTESLKWQDEMAAQTKNMMIYPAFVGAVVLGITFFLMVYLVPQLVGVIQGRGQVIPLQTRRRLGTTAFLVDY